MATEVIGPGLDQAGDAFANRRGIAQRFPPLLPALLDSLQGGARSDGAGSCASPTPTSACRRGCGLHSRLPPRRSALAALPDPFAVEREPEPVARGRPVPSTISSPLSRRTIELSFALIYGTGGTALRAQQRRGMAVGNVRFDGAHWSSTARSALVLEVDRRRAEIAADPTRERVDPLDACRFSCRGSPRERSRGKGVSPQSLHEMSLQFRHKRFMKYR